MPRFLGRIATRAGGGARGTSRRRRGSPGVARRLLGGPILARVVKYVVSEARVRQSVVNLHISQGVPRGLRRTPSESSRRKTDTPLFAFRTRCCFWGSNSMDLHVFFRLL